MQWLEGLLHLIKKLELDEWNDQALDSLIDFSLLITQTYFLYMTSTCDIYLPDFTIEIIIAQLFSRNLKLSILSNHAKYPKELVPYYVLSLFIVLA